MERGPFRTRSGPVEGDAGEAVTFRFDLVDAASERQFASATIPFRLVRDRWARGAGAAPPASGSMAARESEETRS